MGYMKNMVSHKTCFQSPMLQNMSRTCGKSEALKLEGGSMSLLLCFLEGSSQHCLSQLWLMVSPLLDSSARSQRSMSGPEGWTGLSTEQFSIMLWCVSNLSSKYSSILGNLGFCVTPLVSIPEFSDVFLSQFLMVWGLLLPSPCENFFSLLFFQFVF